MSAPARRDISSNMALRCSPVLDAETAPHRWRGAGKEIRTGTQGTVKKQKRYHTTPTHRASAARTSPASLNWALVPVCVEIRNCRESVQFMKGKERDKKNGCSACAVQKVSSSSGAQLVSCTGEVNVSLFEEGTAKRPEGGARMSQCSGHAHWHREFPSKACVECAFRAVRWDGGKSEWQPRRASAV